MAYTQLWLLFHTTGINFLVMRANQDYSIFYPVLVENKDKYHIFPKTFGGRGRQSRIINFMYQFIPTDLFLKASILSDFDIFFTNKKCGKS